MKIIAGLGNPGKEYENTKHNVGFITVDVLADKMGISIKKLKFRALIGEGRIGNEKIILVKPQTYMNLSGESIREIVSFYKIDMEDLLVIYDDIDLPAGTLRIRSKGSAGTHNGMRSVIYQLQDDSFPRIRVGIGGEKKGRDLVKYVISGFPEEDRDKMREAVQKAADAAECAVTEGISAAMNRYNTKKKKKNRKKKEDSGGETSEIESAELKTAEAAEVRTAEAETAEVKAAEIKTTEAEAAEVKAAELKTGAEESGNPDSTAER